MRLLFISFILSFTAYTLVLVALAGVYGFGGKGALIHNALMAIILLVSFLINAIVIKDAWYEANMAYTDYEIAIASTKRIAAFTALALNVVSAFLYAVYIMSLTSA